MRVLFLNLLTLSLTLVLLVALTVPAMWVLHEASGERTSSSQAPSHERLFGVAVDPWHADEWARAVGASPNLLAKFESFSRRRPIHPYLAETERQGVKRLMISWEPWRPVPAARGRDAQFRPQPGYRNIDISRGARDRYITRFARTLAGFDGVVYLRYAHEMNGIWYPWTHDSRSYRRAWRRVVRLVHAAGAHNVRFVWSTNPNLYESPAAWLRRLRRYWPGGRYVDIVGSTAIDFGGQKDYSVARFEPRLRTLHQVFGKPMMITETNTDFAGRVRWLRDFRAMLRTSPWIKAVVWSQLPSRGKAQMLDAGVVDWDVTRDRASAAVLRQIIGDGSAGAQVVRPPPRGG
jgi:Glycosyl hydrolase family 26